MTPFGVLLDRLFLAGRVRSQMAASENSSSLNLGLAEWPLSGDRYFRFGSIAVTKPRKLSGRSQTTSGQPDQLLLRPSAKGRI